MNALPLWANGPFELLVHAEGHLRRGDDFDRRIALISFDNAIEVSIATYLTLHPIHRGNRSYANVDVEKWLSNYPGESGERRHAATRLARKSSSHAATFRFIRSKSLPGALRMRLCAMCLSVTKLAGA